MGSTKNAPRRTQAERSEATTGQLVATARDLFARDGYAGTSLETVSSEAGVTKGALYHHFSSKRDLFRAVFEQEEIALAHASHDAYRRESDPWKGFQAGCIAFLEGSLDPGVQRIVVLDGPSVLGWETVREIEKRHSMAMIEGGLRQAMESGRIATRATGPLAHMLFGALCEGAMTVARSGGDQQAAMREMAAELRSLLAALES